jgi:phosphoglycerate dehydrogenase-like enzyme
MTQSSTFRVGITGDMFDKIMAVDTAREALGKEPGVEVVRFEHGEDPVAPAELDAFDAVLAGALRVSRESTIGLQRLSLVARFGAGYDRVALDGCSEAGVIVTTTPAGIRRAMSTAAMAHMLALSTKYLFKRQCLYEGRWHEAAAAEHIGMGLAGRAIGYVGFGNIGQDLYRLAQPFEMRHLVYDPYLSESAAEGFDIERVDFDTLLAQSDVIVLLCLLTDETRHLIDEDALHRMKNTAYLINVARGAIIDQAALASGEIAGCGLDAYDPDPIAADDPLLKLDNANLTPHALGYTDEMIRLCSELCVEAAIKVRRGEEPDSVINRSVLESAKLKAKMEGYRQRGG